MLLVAIGGVCCTNLWTITIGMELFMIATLGDLIREYHEPGNDVAGREYT